jgi:hypothetical protein
MSRYAREDEERIRTQQLVRDWAGAGLLDRAQGETIASGLQVDLRRTGTMLRMGLALFTAIVVGALVGLVPVALDLDSGVPIGFMLGLAGAGCAWSADVLVSRYRLYRYGIEEMLGACATLLCGTAAGIVTSEALPARHEGWAFAVGMGVAGAVSAAVYRRFGFRYAGIVAIGALVFLPVPFSLPLPVERLLAATLACVAFVIVRRLRHAHEDDVVGDDAAAFEAAAFGAMYLVLNLHVTEGWLGLRGAAAVAPWFRWATYAFIWLLPIGGVWAAVRERERTLLDASGGALLVTLLTNKAYLGLPRQPWDPIVLGVLLIGVALGLRRWLAAAPDEHRGAFTAARLSAHDASAVRIVGIGSVAVNPADDAPVPAPTSGFLGGRSGGAGAGGEF